MLLLAALATWQSRAHNRRAMEDTRSRDTTSRTLSTTSGRGWSRQTPWARFNGTRPTARTYSILTENSTRSSRPAMEDSSQLAEPTSYTTETTHYGL